MAKKFHVELQLLLDSAGKISRAIRRTYPFGVVSSKPCVLGNSFESRWNGKFISKPYDKETNTSFDVSPLFDPTKEYIPRSQRDEWNLVGILGVIPVLNGEIVSPQWIPLPDKQCLMVIVYHLVK